MNETAPSPASWRRAIAVVAGLVCCVGGASLVEAARWLPYGTAPLFAAIGLVAGRGLARRAADARAVFAAPTAVPAILPWESPALDERRPPPSAEIAVPPAEAVQAPNVARARAELGGYPTFTQILNRQLRAVVELSEKAAGSILSNLSGVDARFTALFAFIQQAGSSDQVNQVIAQIDSEMHGCRDQLAGFAARQREDARDGQRQRSKIGDETRGVLAALEGVNDIARQTTMLSFNASIEASRAGDAGKGFAIIAAEIRKLASQVQATAVDIKSRVEALARTVTVELQERTHQREQEEGAAIENISHTLDALADDVTAIVSHQRDVLQKVEAESEAVARPIMEIMGSIQFQDVIRQQLQQLERMAQAVDGHIVAVREMLEDPQADFGEKSLMNEIDEMYANYVMAGQREIHRAATGGPAERETGSLIEMF